VNFVVGDLLVQV